MTGEKKAREEAPNDLDKNEGQNSEVIFENEDHEDTVHSELKTSQEFQHLDELIEFLIAKNDEILYRLVSEVINAVENIKILSL